MEKYVNKDRGVYMKKIIRLLIISAVVTVTLTLTGVAAQASNFEAQADALKEMGLFLGTDNGYELDRLPTRAESAVMLVRLLGKENEVRVGTYDMPFKDVPDWAVKYVGYLYANNLTKGTAAGTYSSDDTCSAQMFATFLLRALGYSDSSGDFTYARALEYAAGIGLVDKTGTFEDFKRDDMAALSYSALFQALKGGGGTTLLEKLVAENAVTGATADKYLASYQNYLDVMYACAAYAEAARVQQSNDTEIDVAIDGQTLALSMQSDIAAAMDGKDTKLKIDSTLTLFGVAQKMGLYYADGWSYVNLAGLKIKSQNSPDSDVLKEINQQREIAEAGDSFYLIESITKTQEETDIIYTVTYLLPDMNSLLDTLLAQVLDDTEIADIQVNNMQTVYTCDSSGKLKSVFVSGNVGIIVSDGQERQTAGMVFRSEMKIIAVGDAVTVTPPADISAYITLNNFGK